MKKVLLDTNILVPLEDSIVVPDTYSSLLRRLSESACTVFVHRASFDDVKRDRNNVRREQSTSKLRKYACREKSDRSTDQLSDLFGTISSENDLSDCHILCAVYDNAVDALVTEDNEMHRRARRSGIHERVFRVREMLDFLGAAQGAQTGTLSFVEARYCYQVNADDPIFESLTLDYRGFRNWWRACCNSDRRCWVVRDNTEVAGLVVYKDENSNGGDGRFLGRRVLKLCTFKVSEKHRGGRLGEQLLKQSLWFAYSKQYQVVYLTVFPKQQSLADLLVNYGFALHSVHDGELVYVRDFEDLRDSADSYEWHLLNYPVLGKDPNLSAVVPIKSEFHKRLLPEASKCRTPDFFDGLWSSDLKERHIPATSIRKVYVCGSNLKLLPRGTRLYFYVSSNDELTASQEISAVGILEDYREVFSVEELQRLTAKRSVYREHELRQIFESGRRTRLMNFIIVGIVEPRISLAELTEANILKAAPQSITRLSSEASHWLAERARLSHLS